MLFNCSFSGTSHHRRFDEDYLYSDSNTCLIKLGLFGETIVNLMMDLDGVASPRN